MSIPNLVEKLTKWIEEHAKIKKGMETSLQEGLQQIICEFLEDLMKQPGFEIRWYKGREPVIVSKVKLPLNCRLCIWVEKIQFSTVPVRLLWRDNNGSRIDARL